MILKKSFLGLGFLLIAQSTIAATDSDSLRVIIKYKQQPKALTSLKMRVFKYVDVPLVKVTPMANGAYSLIFDAKSNNSLISSNKDSISVLLDKLHQDSSVLYAVQDRVGYFKPVPDPLVSEDLSALLSHDSQWDEFTRPAGIMLETKPGLKDGAWAYTTGQAKNPVVVAVLDTGIAMNESLVNNLLKNDKGQVWGWNFAKNNNNLLDDTGSYHGTHVSGTIAAYGTVINGIGEDLKILTLKIPDDSGMFYESAVVNAIYWAVGAEVPGVPINNYPAKVLNMSFGVDVKPGKEVDYCDEALQEAVFYARKKGAVLAVAAGNENVWEHLMAPAACNGTIKIASTGPEGLRSYFSNYGPSVSFAAPGGDKRYGTAGGILSTVNPGGGYNGSGYDFYQGTSMASPHVAGVAGLIFAVSNKRLKAEEVEQLLYTTTHGFGQSTDSNKSCVGKKPCGHGILDAENAVKAAMAGYDVLFTAPPVSTLKRDSCVNQLMYSEKNEIDFNGTHWLQQHTRCKPEASYQLPQVKQDKNGDIVAYYGAVSYQLDQTSFRECHITGFDGIGCFLNNGRHHFNG